MSETHRAWFHQCFPFCQYKLKYSVGNLKKDHSPLYTTRPGHHSHGSRFTMQCYAYLLRSKCQKRFISKTQRSKCILFLLQVPNQSLYFIRMLLLQPVYNFICFFCCVKLCTHSSTRPLFGRSDGHPFPKTAENFQAVRKTSSDILRQPFILIISRPLA